MPKKVVMTVNGDDMTRVLTEYNELTKQIKMLDERKKVLADTIKNYALNNGSKDDKGSFYCEKDNFVFGAQCKKSISLNETKAKELITSKGYDDCLKSVITIDEEAFENHISCGDFTPEEIESVTNMKTSYAVTVKTSEEMPEVQTETVAASRKPRILRK